MTDPLALVLAVYLAVTVLVIAAVHAWDLGREELRSRWTLAWLALNGRDYSQPQLGFLAGQQFQLPDPNQVDDPVTAYLLRASEAERRYFALQQLLKDLHDDPDLVPAPLNARDGVIRTVGKWTWAARDDARGAILDRLQTRRHRDEDSMVETVVVEDPLLNYRRRVRLTDQEIVREDLGRAKVSQMVDRTPDVILDEVVGEVHG